VSDCLRVEQKASVWTLTLNRPQKRNALDEDLVQALSAAVDQAHAEQADVLVFQGQGTNLCAGFDFTGFDQMSHGDLLLRFVRIEQLLQKIDASPALTVCLAHGKNFGAGVDLLAACKHRVASAEASFRMPGLKFGLVLGTRRLAHLIGAAATREVQQTAQTLSAGQAHALGLVSELAEMPSWPQVVDRQQLAAQGLSPQARATLYRVLRRSHDQADLAELVDSAAVPGLKQRIANYRASQ
jgi:enoyl-CoA hydratase